MALPDPSNQLRSATAAFVLWTLLAPQAGVFQSLEPLGRDAHVIIIIVDGLRPDLITAERTPTLQRLVDEGASTLDAKTVRPSITLPAITSMIGRSQSEGVSTTVLATVLRCEYRV